MEMLIITNKKVDNKKPLLKQWTSLYNLAAEIKEIQPWDKLWDIDIITIKLPNYDEPAFVSIMGQGGNTYGIGVYYGYESFLKLSSLISQDIDTPSSMELFTQDCITCYFGDREEIEPEDREIMNKLGLKFRGRNAWTYFRSMKPGLYPWFINREQAELMIEVFQNFLEAYKYMISSDEKIDFEKGETLFRYYSEEDKEWKNTSKQISEFIKYGSLTVLKDELLLKQLEKQPKNNSELEYDIFYFPTPIQENKKDVPFLPAMALLVSVSTGEILDQFIMDKKHGRENITFGIIINHIMENGRPSKIYVRDHRIANILIYLCEKIDVKLEIGKGMPVINTFFENFLEFM